jgi:hypothetical protein
MVTDRFRIEFLKLKNPLSSTGPAGILEASALGERRWRQKGRRCSSVTVPVICPISGLGALTSCATKGAAMANAVKISRQIRRVLTTKAPMDQRGI